MAKEPDPAPAAATSEVPVATIEHDNSAVEDFVEENKTKLILGVAAVLLAIVVYMLVSFKSESGKSTAAAALTGAETVAELQAVVNEFPNSVVAGSAELLIAAKLMEEDKAEESRTALQKFVDTRKGHPLYLKGVSDLGLREHVDGNLDKAVSLLKEATVSGEAPGFIEQTALLRLGDALTAQGLAAMASGDESQAKVFFEEATQAFEDLEAKAAENSTYKRTAAQRRERLPHLSIKPLSPEEAEAEAAAAAPAVIEPIATDPVEVAPAEEVPPAGEGEGEGEAAPAEEVPPAGEGEAAAPAGEADAAPAAEENSSEGN